MIKQVCIAGAGTMGSGIAVSSAQAGFVTCLFDVNEQGLKKAQHSNEKILQTAVEKGKLTEQEKQHIADRIVYVNDIKQCQGDLIIEAIIENIELKTNLFQQLVSVNVNTSIFASNTSSLSINAIQKEIALPERFAGLHFFNPAHLMKLVEVVRGEQTSDETIKQLVDFCLKLKKVPVLCNDSPGFIVNRVARHYYLEAMHLVEAGLVTMQEADLLLENAGFKMGPFKLMDLIGNDINLAVSQSLYDAFEKNPRFKPNALQEELVRKGELGKKTGKGFYTYT